MKHPKVSIIVPIFKVESYLRECLDSISYQTFTDWECLLIDDGSPDKSGTICDDYAGKDLRFKVFHKQNGGVSSARNLGLEFAIGEWVTFVDADDIVGVDYLSVFINNIESDKSIDYIQGCFIQYTNRAPLSKNAIVKSEYNNDPIALANRIKGYVCSKFLRNAIIKEHNIRFQEDIRLAEDMIFTLDYICYVHGYILDLDTPYYYRVDHGANSSKNMELYQYGNYKLSIRGIYNSIERYIFTKRIKKELVNERYKALSSQFFDLLTFLYHSKTSKTDKFNFLKNDWDVNFISNIYNKDLSLPKRWAIYLLKNRLWTFFDIYMNILTFIKR